MPCPAAPGPLEGYAVRFDDLFGSLAQRRGFREYLAGLLALRDRNKTLTALAGAEPVAGACHPAVQRLQFFLSESRWDAGQVNARRLALLRADPATARHGGGVLVIDDSGDRKDGAKTAHVGHQWLGRYGKTDNGVVTVTTLWADKRQCASAGREHAEERRGHRERRGQRRPRRGTRQHRCKRHAVGGGHAAGRDPGGRRAGHYRVLQRREQPQPSCPERERSAGGSCFRRGAAGRRIRPLQPGLGGRTRSAHFPLWRLPTPTRLS